MAKDKEITKLQEEIDSLTQRLKRALADYDNLQKRLESEREAWVALANARLLQEILPVFELLKKAAAHSQDSGLGLVLKDFDNVLKRQHLEEIGEAGADFDPNFHEAVAVVEGDQDNKIAEVVRGGYRLGDQVLVPAQVKVFKKHD